jgi:hypothetical protein
LQQTEHHRSQVINALCGLVKGSETERPPCTFIDGEVLDGKLAEIDAGVVAIVSVADVPDKNTGVVNYVTLALWTSILCFEMGKNGATARNLHELLR